MEKIYTQEQNDFYNSLREKTAEELIEFDESVLDAYHIWLKVKTAFIQAEIKVLNEKAEKDRKRAEKMIKKTNELRAETEMMLRDKGWWGITDAEFKWLRENYKDKGEKIGQYFTPSLDTIKERYAKSIGKKHLNQPNPLFKLNPAMECTNGWISPAGKYLPVGGFAMHEEWAREYFEEHRPKLYEKLKGTNVYFYMKLQEQNWIRVMKWPNIPVEFSYNKVTDKQKQTVRDYCLLHNAQYPFPNDNL